MWTGAEGPTKGQSREVSLGLGAQREEALNSQKPWPGAALLGEQEPEPGRLFPVLLLPPPAGKRKFCVQAAASSRRAGHAVTVVPGYWVCTHQGLRLARQPIDCCNTRQQHLPARDEQPTPLTPAPPPHSAQWLGTGRTGHSPWTGVLGYLRALEGPKVPAGPSPS